MSRKIKRKKRNPNLTEEEFNIMLDQVGSQQGISTISKESTVATKTDKKKAWEDICSKGNTCNSTQKHTAEEIKKNNEDAGSICRTRGYKGWFRPAFRWIDSNSR